MILLVFLIFKEFPEMIYQYEQDYIFDRSKFEKPFGVKPNPPEMGIKELVKNITIISKKIYKSYL